MRYLLLGIIFVPWTAFAAGGLSLSPVYATHSIGETFEVRVLADTGGEPISAAEAELRFDPGALAVEDVSAGSSILSTFSTGPNFSNEEGVIRFAGWTAQPFTGTEGLLVTITFRPLRNIVVDVRFASGALLASDSRGSNVLERMGSGLYAIRPRGVSVVPPENAEDVSAGEISSAYTEQPEPPVLDEYDERLEVGERIVVRGRAAPNGLVTVYITKDETSDEASVVSASDGSFTYVSAEGAEEGIYRVAADVETSDGFRSARADRVVITVAPASLADVAAAAIPLSDEALPFVALIGLAIFGMLLAGYVVHRILGRKRRVGA